MAEPADAVCQARNFSPITYRPYFVDNKLTAPDLSPVKNQSLMIFNFREILPENEKIPVAGA
ncbi:MAG: hypothetical protein LBP95_06520 [Deltaproteobacteria bacterium]|jgi:hypothetical protein|nr:hypothetical protein [Deltaproteobacteria bacterium]